MDEGSYIDFPSPVNPCSYSPGKDGRNRHRAALSAFLKVLTAAARRASMTVEERRARNMPKPPKPRGADRAVRGRREISKEVASLGNFLTRNDVAQASQQKLARRGSTWQDPSGGACSSQTSLKHPFNQLSLQIPGSTPSKADLKPIKARARVC